MYNKEEKKYAQNNITKKNVLPFHDEIGKAPVYEYHFSLVHQELLHFLRCQKM